MRELIRMDIKDAGVPGDKWYEKATASKVEWRRLCCKMAEEIQQQQSLSKLSLTNHLTGFNVLSVYGNSGEKCLIYYMKRHECLDERRKPINEQRGAEQCSICERWFARRGGLAVH